MKKLSVAFLTAMTVAIGTVSVAIPAQAAIVMPEIPEGYYYQHIYFDEYPPEVYEGGDGFVGTLQAVHVAPNGGYYGDYFGHNVNY